MTPAPLLRLQGLGKAYRDVPVFDAVSLEMAPGEVVALVGDSGVGKSTLLNCIAGLDRADRGRSRSPAARCSRSTITPPRCCAARRWASSSRPSMCCRI